MKVEDAIKKFFMDLVSFLNDKDTIEDLEDIQSSYEVDSLEDFLKNVESIHLLSENETFKFLIDIIQNKLSEEIAEDEFKKIVDISEFYYLDSSQDEFKFRVRDFSFGDDKGAVISLNSLSNSKKYEEILSDLDLQILKDYVFKLIILIGTMNSNNNKKKQFFEFLLSDKQQIIILMTKNNSITKEEIYSYLYFAYLAKGYRTIIPDTIIYNYALSDDIKEKIKALSPEDFNFIQFFEILDVLDEYHQVEDILLKFLKLYQILEYLVIRTLLVKIQRNTRIHKQFLRELMSLKRRDDFDKKLFKELFSIEKDNLIDWFRNLINNNSTIEREIEKYTKKTLDGNSNDDNYWLNYIADLLYQLRNSIVHNKESDYHLTVHTISDETVRLIKNILNKFEEIILDKIVSCDNKITYSEREIKLY